MMCTLTGAGLSVAQLNRVARCEDTIDVEDEAQRRVEAAHASLNRAAANGAVYGATTGVGANRSVTLGEETKGHAFALWRSSCTGIGPLMSPWVARAAMTVRLNQILAGGSGLSPTFAHALATAIYAGRSPVLHDGGSIGTGDLSALGELALTLAGERPWADGTTTRAVPAVHDGLPFLSSSAVTLAFAAETIERVAAVMDALTVVSALSSLALRGSVQPALPPHDPAFAASALLFLSVAQAPSGTLDRAVRIQDPFGLRALPQVHGSAADALSRACDVVELGINGIHENPRIDGDAIIHNGRFHTARLGLALDSVRTAMLSVAVLSSARTSKLMDPAFTGLTPFLSDGAPGSSGLLMSEYVVEDAIAELRLLASPPTSASVSISLGVEEHASFAPQSARALGRMLDHIELIATVEMVAAHRALCMDPDRIATEPAARVLARLGRGLSAQLQDRPMEDDISSGRRMLLSLAGIASHSR